MTQDITEVAVVVLMPLHLPTGLNIFFSQM